MYCAPGCAQREGEGERTVSQGQPDSQPRCHQTALRERGTEIVGHGAQRFTIGAFHEHQVAQGQHRNDNGEVDHGLLAHQHTRDIPGAFQRRL